jgi:hypothetical protein
VNTSAGQPVTEATALVARLLARSRTAFAAEAPDVRRAIGWLVHNQNEDGGWGSFSGQASRVWLTTMAVHALGELGSGTEALRRGVTWLIRARDPQTHGWGERPGTPATVTHTAYALIALTESGAAKTEDAVAQAVSAGYQWFLATVDTTSIHDDHARMESYNVTRSSPDGSPVTWQSTIWHHGLPFAIGALVRQPGSIRFDLILDAVATLRQTQLPDGRWPGADSSTAASVWTVWPFLEALADVAARIPLRAQGALTALAPGAALLQNGAELDTPPRRLIASARIGAVRGWLRRRWAPLTLATIVTAGGTLVVADVFSAQEVLLGVGVPVLLLVIQQATARTRSAR